MVFDRSSAWCSRRANPRVLSQFRDAAGKFPGPEQRLRKGTSSMNAGRVGFWLIGPCGGVGSTVAVGLAALRRDLTDTISLVTALPEFAGLKLDDFAQFVIGGHDIRQTSLRDGV